MDINLIDLAPAMLYIPPYVSEEEYGFFAPVVEDDIVRDIQELMNAIVHEMEKS